MPGIRLTWKPPPAFGGMLKQIANPYPLNIKIVQIMRLLVNEHHRRGGTTTRWQRPWSWANRHIWNGWQSQLLSKSVISAKGFAGARLTNRRRWAVDFYYGHPARITHVKQYRRRIRRKTNLSAPTGHPIEYVGKKRKTMRTVGWTTVRAHNRRIRAHPPHYIWWPRKYIKRAEDEILKHILKPK